MSKHKFSLRRLFSNTKFLIVFSIVLAFIFWIVVALQYAPVVENVIKDVPVNINMDNSVPDKMGLQIFGQSEYTVDITVKGNRYIVGGNLLSADDFEVTAQTAYVNSAGNHNLQLKVTAKDADADYEIEGLSADYIEVYFDTYEEKEIEVTPRIISELDSYTDEEYLFDEKDIMLTNAKVTIEGAKTEIDRINAVYADIEIDDKLTESTTLDAILNFDAESISYVNIKEATNMTMPVTLPVYKTMALNTSVEFKNTPSAYINKAPIYTVSPSSAKVAVLQNGGEDKTTLEVGSIDFNKICDGENIYEFNASQLADIKMLDGTTKFTVTVDMSAYTTTTLKLDESKITVSGGSTDSIDVDYSGIGDITVVGTSADLEGLTDSSLSAKIDLSAVKLTEDYQKVKLNITVNGSTTTWAYGDYYAKVKTK